MNISIRGSFETGEKDNIVVSEAIVMAQHKINYKTQASANDDEW